jgi:ATP-binding cassette, subfamily B (MDR/TAP), member 1
MTWTSERLTRRLRHMYFQYTLRQDIVYFDQDDHTTGALTSALSLDPTQVQQLVGTNFGLMLIVLVNLVGGSIVALAYGWKMALVVIFGGVPFIFAGYPTFLYRG